MAADIYTTPGQSGRGGWTWYTGSSGLMYRLILESVLGMRLRGNALSFRPCLPTDWDGFTLQYRFGATTYTVVASRVPGAAGPLRITLDGVNQDDGVIALRDDGQARQVRIELPGGR
ncbi:N,N'-diacetylchitobiose phosphorylase [compost metagenome]